MFEPRNEYIRSRLLNDLLYFYHLICIILADSLCLPPSTIVETHTHTIFCPRFYLCRFACTGRDVTFPMCGAESRRMINNGDGDDDGDDEEE